MTRSKILVNTAFIINHRNNPAGLKTDIFLSTPTIVWLQINQLITDVFNNKIFLINTRRLENKEENPILFKLLNAIYSNETENIKLIKTEEEALSIEEKQLNLYCFLDDKKIDNPEIEKSLVFTSSEILNRWIFTTSDCLLSKGMTWNFYFAKKHYTTHIIIEDAYIFANEQNICTNFIPLLNNLFSLGNKKCKLLVITHTLFELGSEGVTDVNQVSITKRIYEKICCYLADTPYLKDKIDFTLAMVEQRSLVHNRHIFSDYFRISLDNSVQFFDKEGNYRLKISTPVRFYSHTINDDFKKTRILIKEAKDKFQLKSTILIGNFDPLYFDLW